MRPLRPPGSAADIGVLIYIGVIIHIGVLIHFLMCHYCCRCTNKLYRHRPRLRENLLSSPAGRLGHIRVGVCGYAPVVCGYAPVVCGYAPVVCGHAPVVCGYAPVVCGYAPVVCGHAPVVCGYAPVVCGYAPVVCGYAPVVCGHATVVCGHAPVVCGYVPGVCGSSALNLHTVTTLYRCHAYVDTPQPSHVSLWRGVTGTLGVLKTLPVYNP